MDNDTHSTIAIMGALFVIGIGVGMLVGTHDCKVHPEKYGIEIASETTTMETTTQTAATTTAITTIITTTFDEITTTTTSSTATTTTTTTVTTTTTTTTETTMTTVTAAPTSRSSGMTYLGSFTGTYYAGNTVPCRGGSGRTLLDCSIKDGDIKGSVASKYVYQNYGYNLDDRTKIYIEVSSIPDMTGWYYVDDCNASNSIIDFYFYRNSNSPFRQAGVISVKAYI